MAVRSGPTVRISSDGGPATKVVLIRPDGSELDVSDFVTRVVWEHDANGLPTARLDLMPGVEIEGLAELAPPTT